ncbi:hypothetical protein TNCV_4938341 [Trichonephila clavipes]|nr:hypothetical protein TNCV_4938341 [Trichonephila clavipes]
MTVRSIVVLKEWVYSRTQSSKLMEKGYRHNLSRSAMVVARLFNNGSGRDILQSLTRTKFHARFPPLRTLSELELALLEEWVCILMSFVQEFYLSILR